MPHEGVVRAGLVRRNVATKPFVYQLPMKGGASWNRAVGENFRSKSICRAIGQRPVRVGFGPTTTVLVLPGFEEGVDDPLRAFLSSTGLTRILRFDGQGLSKVSSTNFDGKLLKLFPIPIIVFGP